MIFDFDKFDRYSHPNLFLCQPNEEIIGQISNYDNLNITPKFNDMSEISFNIYKFLDNGEVSNVYDKVEKLREIFVTNFYVREESEVSKIETIHSLSQKYPTLASFGNNSIQHYYSRNPDDDNDGRPLGYFIITDISETQNLTNPYKTVTALSCEYELSKKELHYINGTYKIFDPDDNDCLINQILLRLPKWELNYIDNTVANLYRTFEFGENTIYNFLTSDFSESADAIVEFDVYNRYISIYAEDTYIAAANQYAGIVISLNDVIDEIKADENMDDLYTALYVPSDGDLNIANVNPSRGNTIYNFDSYMNSEWMSSGLISALTSVKNAINASYNDCNVTVNNTYKSTDTSDYQIVTHNTITTVQGVTTEIPTVTNCDLYKRTNNAWSQITIANCTVTKPLAIMKSYEMWKYVTIESELDTLQNVDLAGYESQKAAVISSDATAATKNSQIATINGYIATTNQQINVKRSQLTSKETQIDNIDDRLDTLSENTKLESVLTEAQLNELSPFIHEGSFSDDTIIVTDGMSYVEEYNQSEALYKKAVKSLNTLSKPNKTFGIDINSSIFNKNFKHIANMINTGSVINIIDLDDNCEQYILHAFDIDFDSASVKLTFGNRFYLSDPISTFADLYSSTSKTGNTVNYIKNTFNFSKANTELSASETFRKSSLDLSRNNITSSDNQSVEITDNGYIGRRVASGAVSNEQCWLVNNALAFTDDNWTTVKTALGKIPIYDSGTGTTTYYYGLNTEVLIGKIILGEKMWIGDANGDVLISGSGVDIRNGKLKITNTSTTDTSLLIDTPNFTVANNGDMTCHSGSFSGNIYLTGNESKLLIGEHGVLNHLQFKGLSDNNLFGVGWSEILDAGIIESYVTVHAYIPSNFHITQAYITLEHRPLYCLWGMWYGGGVGYTFTNQRQWARNIGLFRGVESGPFEYVESSGVAYMPTTKGSEITSVFGQNGWTPSNTAINTITSSNIYSYLTSGQMNKFVIGTRDSQPAEPTTKTQYLNNVFSKCGIVSAYLDVYGYVEQT